MTPARRDRFARIYDANYAPLLGYALRRTATDDDAQDVVSDTFVVAWRRLDDVPEGDRARLWLFGTARRVLGNHYRSKRRRGALEDRLRTDLPRLTPFTVDARGDDELPAIVAAFRRLSEADREVLLLAGWEELDASQIGEVVGCKPAAARVRLHRARNRFAAALEREGVSRPGAPGHDSSRWAAARPGKEDAR